MTQVNFLSKNLSIFSFSSAITFCYSSNSQTSVPQIRALRRMRIVRVRESANRSAVELLFPTDCVTANVSRNLRLWFSWLFAELNMISQSRVSHYRNSLISITFKNVHRFFSSPSLGIRQTSPGYSKPWPSCSLSHPTS
jgi:hypothetical protein